MDFPACLDRSGSRTRVPRPVARRTAASIVALILTATIVPATASPVIEAPTAQLYSGDVLVRVSGQAPGATCFLEIQYFSASGWSSSFLEQSIADADGTLDASLPASWLDQQAAGAVRWRLRACADEAQTQCSDWQMFGRSFDQSAPNAAATSGGAGATEPAGRSRTVPADPAAPLLAAPTPGSYTNEVPLLIQSPASGPVAAFVMQLEAYDRTTDSFVPAHEEQVAADPTGTVSSALLADALAGLRPGVARWRIRARPADAPSAWSAWVVFSMATSQ